MIRLAELRLEQAARAVPFVAPALLRQIVRGYPRQVGRIILDLHGIRHPIRVLDVEPTLGETGPAVAALVREELCPDVLISGGAAVARITREVAAEHDVRHVFEDDAELPLVVVAVLRDLRPECTRHSR